MGASVEVAAKEPAHAGAAIASAKKTEATTPTALSDMRVAFELQPSCCVVLALRKSPPKSLSPTPTGPGPKDAVCVPERAHLKRRTYTRPSTAALFTGYRV